MNNKIKHLEMVEKIIERMAQNSFTLKGWAVTLVVAIFTLMPTCKNTYTFIVYIPIFAFWFLDSYYLRFERKYKLLYKQVLHKADDIIDFSLDIREINIDAFSKKETRRSKYFNCLMSITEAAFYLPIAAVIYFLIFLN